MIIIYWVQAYPLLTPTKKPSKNVKRDSDAAVVERMPNMFNTLEYSQENTHPHRDMHTKTKE